MLRTLWWLMLTTVACGPVVGPLESEGFPVKLARADAPPADAPGPTLPHAPRPLKPPVLDCGNLVTHASSADTRGRLDRMLASLWTRGDSGASLDVSGGEANFSQLSSIVAGPTVSPVQAVLERLHGLDGSPVEPKSLALDQAPDLTQDIAVLALRRVAVGSTPVSFRHPMLVVWLVRKPAGWRLLSVTMDLSQAFATEGDARAMAACAPLAGPLEDRIPTWKFSSVQMIGCGIEGTHEYQATLEDQLKWTGEARWETGRATGDERRWRLVREGTFTISPENYWPHMERADCLCPKEAGFRIEVDVLSGALTRYWAGISCVVC